jgi:hypothetical protein
MVSVRELVDFASILGIAADDLASVEAVDVLRHTFSVDGSRVAALRPAHAHSLLSAYPAAVRCEFRTGDYVELVIDENVRDADIEGFTARAASGSYDVVVELRKDVLIQQALGGKPPTSEVVLFMFVRAVNSYLARGLTDFEDQVWPQPERRLVVLISDTDVELEGHRLWVLGGDALARAAEIAHRQDIHAAQVLPAMAKSRDRYISWDTSWSRRLTPLHFQVSGTCSDARLLGLIHAQFVKLAVLFTCDRARQRQREGTTPEIRAEFRGREHAAVIVIDESDPLEGVDDGALASIARMIEWCYQADTGPPHREWVADRLPFVQTRVAQTLEGRPEEERFRAFAQGMPFLAEGLEWHWKAFIEGKVSEYLDRVQQVEGLVADTVDRLSDQVGGLVKQLSDTMLAAVAVLIGSFIAAAFKDPFNATLFRIALLTYAFYVGVFPALIGMLANARSFFRVRDGFEFRKRRYAEALLPDKVSEIVGRRVVDAAKGYWWAFGMVAGSYALMVLAATFAAFEVPGHIT